MSINSPKDNEFKLESKSDSLRCDIYTSGNASLTTLTIGESGAIGTLTVSGTALAALNTIGIILNTVVKNNASLATFDFQHTHVDGEFATTVDIQGNTNAGFTSLNLSTLSKV